MDEEAVELWLLVEVVLHDIVQRTRKRLLRDLVKDLRAGEDMGDAVQAQGLLPVVGLRLAARGMVVAAHLAQEMDWGPDDVARVRGLCDRFLRDAAQTLEAIRGPDIPEVFRRAFADEEP
jgi:hypothetical protein